MQRGGLAAVLDPRLRQREEMIAVAAPVEIHREREPPGHRLFQARVDLDTARRPQRGVPEQPEQRRERRRLCLHAGRAADDPACAERSARREHAATRASPLRCDPRRTPAVAVKRPNGDHRSWTYHDVSGRLAENAPSWNGCPAAAKKVVCDRSCADCAYTPALRQVAGRDLKRRVGADARLSMVVVGQRDAAELCST